MSDLETEEEARKSKIGKTDVNYDDIIKNLKDIILNLETKLKASKLSNEKKRQFYNNLQEHVNIFKKYVSIRNNITKEDKIKIYNMLNKFENNIENINNDSIKKADDMLNKFDNRINIINNKILKIKKVLNEKKI